MKKYFITAFMVFNSLAGLLAGNPDSGYGNSDYASMTLAANATGSFTVTSSWTLQYCDLVGDGSSFSFTVNSATATVYIASQTSEWEEYPGTYTIKIRQQIMRGSHLWIQNGSNAQKIRLKSYGF